MKKRDFLYVIILAGLIVTQGCRAKDKESEPSNMNKSEKPEYSNHLDGESSPYLLQHARNPVDWYPWGEEALRKARAEDRPIFLSIGYAACHWCHVMEEESFENSEVANILNENFISIKVDREQRPDLDQIYMAATTAMTGSGGWPMTVFLTPDLKPFYAGTYFPPEDRYGKPGFKRLIEELARIYRTDRTRIDQVADQLTDALISSSQPAVTSVPLNQSVIQNAVNGLLDNFDRVNGGFGGAPKFPRPTDLSFLMKYYISDGNKDVLAAVEHTLASMARGGIYDHLGGGFHRYATDEKWLIPHFEKMLYDNAMLAVTCSEAYQLTGKDYYKKIASETLDFILREMTDNEGGFYSSLDADSDGEEGKFYVWKKDEIERVLGKDAALFCDYYNITQSGNFENGTNILNIGSYSDRIKSRSEMTSEEFDTALKRNRQLLYKERLRRAKPFTDDKIITSWNGLAISGLSRGYMIKKDERYRAAAVKAADFIKNNLYKNDRLIHSWHRGKGSEGQFLEDYAYLTAGLIKLYEISYDYGWIRWSVELAQQASDLFADRSGNLYLSPADQDDHFMRPKDIGDGALPAPGSVFMESLLKLSDITGHEEFGKLADKYLSAISYNLTSIPYGMISAVSALNYMLSDRMQVVLVGTENREPFIDEIYSHYLPNSILIVSNLGEEDIALLKGKQNGGPAVAYICRNFTCRLPADNVTTLKTQLKEVSSN